MKTGTHVLRNTRQLSSGLASRLFNPSFFSVGMALILWASSSSAASVVAWGANQYGQTNAPVGLDAVSVAGGAAAQHVLAIRPDGTIVAWGKNDTGQTDVPADLANVVQASAGGGHSLALTAGGAVVAW